MGCAPIPYLPQMGGPVQFVNHDNTTINGDKFSRK